MPAASMAMAKVQLICEQACMCVRRSSEHHEMTTRKPAAASPATMSGGMGCWGGSAGPLTSFTGGTGGLQGLAGQLHALRLHLRPHRILARQHAGDGLPHLGSPWLRPGVPGQAGGLSEGPVRGPAAQAGEAGLHDQPLGGCGLYPGVDCSALLLLLLLLEWGGRGVLLLQPGLGWGRGRAGRAPRSSRARGALCMLLLLLLGRLLLLWGGTRWSLWGLHSRLGRMLRRLETGLWLGLGLGGSSGGCSWLRACAGHWGYLGQAGLFSSGDPAPLPPCKTTSR